MKDLEETSASLYRMLRRKGSLVTAAEARSIWRRTGRSTFIAGPDGVMPSRLARISELRVLASRQWPVGFVGTFDR